MTDFRTTDQVRADFRRLDPNFTRINSAADLFGIAQILDGTTSGPTLFNLGTINGPEWEGVTRFLNSNLVSREVRYQITGRPDTPEARRTDLVHDLQAADTDHDGFLNNQEIVAFVQAHPDRWPNVVTFRSAADLVLNRLPSYLAQTNLSSDQISHLWGIMNQLAREWDQAGAGANNRGLVYGLSLAGFPSTDQNNPPDLIRRAMRGELNPDELAAVHNILQVQTTGQGYNFQNGSAPMNPLEIGGLSLVLDRAAAAHHSLFGMTLVSGDAETQLYTERNRSLTACHDAVQRAGNSNNAADVDRAYNDCATNLNRVETDQNAHPDQIGIHDILLRARAGALTPAETAALRTWMQREMTALGMNGQTCSGAIDCFGQGALSAVRQLITNPHNWAFIGGSMLFKRMLLRNLFASRLAQICGGPVANPAQAYKDYERFMDRNMAQSSRWRRFMHQVVRNPGRPSFWGKAGINFPVNVLHLMAFNRFVAEPMNGLWNRLADPATHPHLNNALQYLTDLSGILLFNAWEAFDAMNTPAIQGFAAANPGACQQAPLASQAPPPENVQSSVTAAYYNGTIYSELMMSHPELNSLQPRQFFTDFPPEIQVAFMSDPQEAHTEATLAWNIQGSNLERALMNRYGSTDAERAQIQNELQPLLDVYRHQGATPGFLMALRLYILPHELKSIENRSHQVAPEFVQGELTYAAAVNALEPGLGAQLMALPYQPNYMNELTRIAQMGKFPSRMGQADYALYLNRVPGASTGTALVAADLPAELQFLQTSYNYNYSDAEHQLFQNLNAQNLAEVMVQHYAHDDATAARIRADVPRLLSPFTQPQDGASWATQVNGAKWALQWYVSRLSLGELPSDTAVQATVLQAQTSGIIGGYFDIMDGYQLNMHYGRNFQQATETHWQSVNYRLASRAVDAEVARRGWERAYGQYPSGVQNEDGSTYGPLTDGQGHPIYKDRDGNTHAIDMNAVARNVSGRSDLMVPVFPVFTMTILPAAATATVTATAGSTLVNAPNPISLRPIETPAGEVVFEVEGGVPGELPVGELPVGETPIGEIPIGEIPVGEMPVGELPFGELPFL